MTGRGSGVRSLVCLSLVGVVVLLAKQSGVAQVSDRPAPVLTYPYLSVNASSGIDTLIQLSNVCAVPVRVQCFFENTTPHCCDNLGCSTSTCINSVSECPMESVCSPTWIPLPFPSPLGLTPRQPLGWRLSEGAADLPFPQNLGPIPAAPESPFVGALRCISIDGEGLPTKADCLIGSATVETYLPGPPSRFDVARYNAIGSAALAGTFEDSRAATQSPRNVSLPFLYDDVVDPLSQDNSLQTLLVILSGSVDFTEPGRFVPGTFPPTPTPTSTSTIGSPTPTPTATPSGTWTTLGPDTPTPRTVIQFIVYNEFEQRFSTSASLDKHLVRRLSRIGTSNPSASVFNVAISGTVAGRFTAQATGRGEMVVALESRRKLGDPSLVSSEFRGVQVFGLGADDSLTLWSPTPTETPPATPEFTSTPTRTVTPVISPAATITSTRTPTASVTVTATRSSTSTPVSTETPTGSPSRTETTSPTATDTFTVVRSTTPTLTPSPTNSSTATPTPSPSLTPTVPPTNSPTSTPTATAAFTSTLTPTPVHTPLPCTGSCDNDGHVEAHDLRILIRIALAQAAPAMCAGGIPIGESIDIALLVQAVNNASSGCPAE